LGGSYTTAEEHAKRYAEAPEPLTSSECSYEKLPTPWRSALANRRVRAEVCAFIAEGFAQRFAARRRTFPHKEAYIIVHGAGKTIKKISSAGLNDMPEHAGATQIGEGDMAVAYWVHQFPQDNVVVRVLDSDEIPILMLRAQLGQRTAPLYVWLVSAGKIEGPPTKQYPFLPCEHHTLIDILALNAAVKKSGTDIPLFIYYIIAQKTVRRCRLGVSEPMTKVSLLSALETKL
jgi:hypothetical protein